MRLGGRNTWIVLAALLGLVGFVAYQVGLHFWAVHHHRAALESLGRRDFAEARRHFEKALTVWPGEPTIRLQAAQTARRLGDFNEALGHLRICEQKQGPAEPIALERRLLLLQQGDRRGMEALLSFCLDHPETPETPLILEVVIGRMLDDMLPADASDRANLQLAAPALLVNLGKAIDQWLDHSPAEADQIQGLVWRARLHRIQDDQASALRDLNRALALDPDHFQARLNLAMILLAEAPQESLPHLLYLHEHAPEDVRIGYYLGSLYRVLGRLQEARQVLSDLLKDNPDEVSLLLERGELALDEQQLADAERWLRRAFERAPNEPRTNLALSRYYRLTGRAGEAKEYQERFAQLEARRNRTGESPPRPGMGQ
jgi:tetratricopeptide (TPR) repeat protein